MTAGGWQHLGAVAPGGLVDARLQAHHAAQLLAEAGETHIPHTPDTSHSALTWNAPHTALAGGALGETALRVALVMRELQLLLLGEANTPRARFALADQTLSDARRWLEGALREHSDHPLDAKLTHPGFQLPAHDVAAGKTFAPAPDALAELARWFSNMDSALNELAKSNSAFGPVLCWPHHFDLATLGVLARDENGQATRTVGAGFSPGDEAIAQPYFYVNHWPTQKAFNPRAKLGVGVWERQHFHGALLLGEALVTAGDAAAQEQMLAQFLQEAVAENEAFANGELQ